MADGTPHSDRTVIEYTPEQRAIIAHRCGDLQVGTRSPDRVVTMAPT